MQTETIRSRDLIAAELPAPDNPIAVFRALPLALSASALGWGLAAAAAYCIYTFVA